MHGGMEQRRQRQRTRRRPQQAQAAERIAKQQETLKADPRVLQSIQKQRDLLAALGPGLAPAVTPGVKVEADRLRDVLSPFGFTYDDIILLVMKHGADSESLAATVTQLIEERLENPERRPESEWQPAIKRKPVQPVRRPRISARRDREGRKDEREGGAKRDPPFETVSATTPSTETPADKIPSSVDNCDPSAKPGEASGWGDRESEPWTSEPLPNVQPAAQVHTQAESQPSEHPTVPASTAQPLQGNGSDHGGPASRKTWADMVKNRVPAVVVQPPATAASVPPEENAVTQPEPSAAAEQPSTEDKSSTNVAKEVIHKAIPSESGPITQPDAPIFASAAQSELISAPETEKHCSAPPREEERHRPTGSGRQNRRGSHQNRGQGYGYTQSHRRSVAKSNTTPAAEPEMLPPPVPPTMAKPATSPPTKPVQARIQTQPAITAEQPPAGAVVIPPSATAFHVRSSNQNRPSVTLPAHLDPAHRPPTTTFGTLRFDHQRNLKPSRDASPKAAPYVSQTFGPPQLQAPQTGSFGAYYNPYPTYTNTQTRQDRPTPTPAPTQTPAPPTTHAPIQMDYWPRQVDVYASAYVNPDDHRDRSAAKLPPGLAAQQMRNPMGPLGPFGPPRAMPAAQNAEYSQYRICMPYQQAHSYVQPEPTHDRAGPRGYIPITYPQDMHQVQAAAKPISSAWKSREQEWLNPRDDRYPRTGSELDSNPQLAGDTPAMHSTLSSMVNPSAVAPSHFPATGYPAAAYAPAGSPPGLPYGYGAMDSSTAVQMGLRQF